MAVVQASFSIDWAEDGNTTIVYLYLSCEGANNTKQNLLRDTKERHKQRCLKEDE